MSGWLRRARSQTADGGTSTLRTYFSEVKDRCHTVE